ncbi:hypothetical protein PG991_013194 [Apiospora marii]|uniref:PiggyBac transposable element-derived protein domain-containing protein n=1 Tax=Apiospora marii TaxID=335849 RepID=A0ABR1R5A8_9PEZI
MKTSSSISHKRRAANPRDPPPQWEDAVLEEYRDRILLFDEPTNRIIITRELQQPFRPVFHANFESRSVANALFPLRLPVHAMAGVVRIAMRSHQLALLYDSTTPAPPLQAEPLGEIPVSLKRDHFLLGLSWWNVPKRPRYNQTAATYDANAAAFVGAFTTGALDRAMLRQVRNLAHVVEDDPTASARRDPERCLRLHDRMKDLFVGVQVFRRIYITGNRSILIMADQMSDQFDMDMEGLGARQTRNGRSYNGRTILNRGYRWKTVLACHDCQGRLRRRKALP